MFKILQIAGAFCGLIAIIVGGRIWLREQNQQGISKAKDEVIALLNTELGAQRVHSERCDKDVAYYREEIQTVRTTATERVAKAVAEVEIIKESHKGIEIENAGLKAKTDLSPVMDTMHKFFTDQSRINKEVLLNLESISVYFKRINGLLVPILEQKAATT